MIKLADKRLYQAKEKKKAEDRQEPSNESVIFPLPGVIMEDLRRTVGTTEGSFTPKPRYSEECLLKH